MVKQKQTWFALDMRYLWGNLREIPARLESPERQRYLWLPVRNKQWMSTEKKMCQAAFSPL